MSEFDIEGEKQKGSSKQAKAARNGIVLDGGTHARLRLTRRAAKVEEKNGARARDIEPGWLSFIDRAAYATLTQQNVGKTSPLAGDAGEKALRRIVATPEFASLFRANPIIPVNEWIGPTEYAKKRATTPAEVSTVVQRVYAAYGRFNPESKSGVAFGTSPEAYFSKLKELSAQAVAKVAAGDFAQIAQLVNPHMQRITKAARWLSEAKIGTDPAPGDDKWVSMIVSISSACVDRSTAASPLGSLYVVGSGAGWSDKLLDLPRMLPNFIVAAVKLHGSLTITEEYIKAYESDYLARALQLISIAVHAAETGKLKHREDDAMGYVAANLFTELTGDYTPPLGQEKSYRAMLDEEDRIKRALAPWLSGKERIVEEDLDL